MKISDLLGLREIQGRDILFNLRRYHFHKQYEEIQASKPTVWKFESTEHVCRAIERIYIQLHTETGTRNALLLAASRYNRVLSVFKVDNPEDPHLDVESVWSPRPQNEVSDFPRLTSPSLSVFRKVKFPSCVSCVKQSGGLSGHVLVSTAGSIVSKGTLYSIKVHKTLGLAVEFLFEVNGNLWTVDYNSSGTYVALGTNTGSALLDLETRSLVRCYHTESDVISMQFLSSGNVVLCGLRNGSILIFDPRQKQISGNTEASDWSSASLNSHMTSLHAIKLFDIRSVNVVRSYREGRVNSYSHLPMRSTHLKRFCFLVERIAGQAFGASKRETFYFLRCFLSHPIIRSYGLVFKAMPGISSIKIKVQAHGWGLVTGFSICRVSDQYSSVSKMWQFGCS